jgi:hypothetical protein
VTKTKKQQKKKQQKNKKQTNKKQTKPKKNQKKGSKSFLSCISSSIILSNTQLLKVLFS